MKPLQPFWIVIRKFCKKSCFMIFDWSSAIFDQLNRNQTAIETSRNSRIIFLSSSIDWKCCILNFHLENSRTWIFTLWNNILQTQTSLLQPIHVYTYINNSKKLDSILLSNLVKCCVLGFHVLKSAGLEFPQLLNHSFYIILNNHIKNYPTKQVLSLCFLYCFEFP